MESRQLLSATSPVETVFRDLVQVDVLDRRLFYNNSAFDGQTPGLTAQDSQAIATDKTALLPGQTATFANYSSYGRGINGLVVDIAGLPVAALGAENFEFRLGNSPDAGTWTVAPAPAEISVRPGAGLSGSSRVEMVWADGAISKRWLQVTIKATPATGLAKDDVFYFGSAVGETGNSAGDALVDGADQAAVAANAAGTAAITSPFDINRDGAVDAADGDLVAANTTTAGTALQLLSVSQQVHVQPPQRLQTSLFHWGNNGFAAVNNPAIVTTNSGTLLAFAEGRSGSQDATGYAMLMRRSTDGGVTWSPVIVVHQIAPASGEFINSPSPLVDRVTGDVLLLFAHGLVDPQSSAPLMSDVYLATSSDDGLTWTAPRDLTPSVKVTAAGNPGPAGAFPDDPWGWFATGPGHGIQLQHGPHAGRLIIGGDHRLTADVSGKSWMHVIYSDDHGATWHLGGGLVGEPAVGTNHPNDYSNETTLVELSDGSLYASIRVNLSNVRFRGKSLSHDGGITWSDMELEDDLGVHQVHGSLLRLNDGTLLFSAPASDNKYDVERHEMTIWISKDDGASWTKGRTVFFGYAGYSDMTVVGPDTIMLTYARGWGGGLGNGDSQINSPEFFGEIAVARINLRWLESDEPYEFSWYFNEEEPGKAANRSGSSIQDYGPWDQRAWARASTDNTAARYVQGLGGDSALELKDQIGTSGVVLSLAYNEALHVGPNDSFTVQIMLKTTDATGVIVGTRPTVRNWSLQVVDGKVQFSLFDTQNTATITSTAAVNDGQWHHIAAVRDAAGRLLKLYIDHQEAAAAVTDTATYDAGPDGPLQPIDPMYLGAYNTLATASRLGMVVDTLRFTRAALAPERFFDETLVPAKPPAPPEFLPNAPTSLPGLKFWLPAYHPKMFFTDFGSYAAPLPLEPYEGMASRSMLDGSPSGFRVQTDHPWRQVQYAEDPLIGGYWRHVAKPGATTGSQLRVQNQNSGLTLGSLDFIQNTGVFTLSSFVKLGAPTGGYRTIFDTNEGSTSLSGFSLFVQHDGRLFLSLSGGTAETLRMHEAAPAGALAADTWYHVAVVGSGPGAPVKYYVTPVSATQVASFNSTSALAGPDGNYPTDLRHELFIGGRSNLQAAGAAPFNGGLVNEAIFNVALSESQIQQLFLFGKGLTSTAPPWQNPNNPLDINGDGFVKFSDAFELIGRVLGGTLVLPAPGPGFAPPPYLDPTGNGVMNAQDAFLVIGWLLQNPGGSGAAPLAAPSAAADTEGEANDIAQPAASLVSVDDEAAATAPVAAAAPLTAMEPAVPATQSEAGEPIAAGLSQPGAVETEPATTITAPHQEPESAAADAHLAPGSETARVLLIEPRYVPRMTAKRAVDDLFAALGEAEAAWS